jgi:two-component system cell cycle response regulator
MEKKTILVVEDNAFNMKLVRSLLKIGGYNIIEAVTAEEGLELLKTHRPHLILMDIQLPGMDGLEASRQIQTDPDIKDIPILALTAYAMKGDEQKVRDAGCIGYISKPLDTKGFIKTLQTHLPTEPEKKKQDIPEQKKEPGAADAREEIFFTNRILIVDDEPLNVKLLKAKLSRDTYVTIEAFNGQECLDKVKAEHPDLILLDLMMPGIDGFEVTRILKKDPKTRNIPIIHVTALDTSADKARALEAGADEFLNKPINTKELLTRIRSLLRLKKYQEQLSTRKVSEAHFLNAETPAPKLENIDLKATILIADTNKKHVDFLKTHLSIYCNRFFVTGNGKEAVSIAESENIDIVLLDIPLSDMNGHEVCRRLKKMDRTRNIQVITITSVADLESKLKSIELGTDDYLIKPVNELELTARIKSFIKKKAYLDMLVSKCETAVKSSITDQLTTLYNHAFFKHYLGLELLRSLHQKHFLTLVMLDLDNFKNVNDSYGHQEGDRILQAVATVIRSSVREIDVCARYGGEEFAVVLPYTDRHIGSRIAERLWKGIANIQETSTATTGTGRITVSIGVAICPLDALNVEDLIHKADTAMYQAKKAGKNQIAYFSDQ